MWLPVELDQEWVRAAGVCCVCRLFPSAGNEGQHLQPMQSAALGHRAVHFAASVQSLKISIFFPYFSLFSFFLSVSYTASNVDVSYTAFSSNTAT